ncbi:hypothetical protein B0H11DRAFT_2103145 [Mycena galericulata]|nr:hypothetical protein B0H11DRAFT_2103145 [Mycena galericulata]
MADSRPPTLPALAAVGCACYECHALPSESIKLQKCSGCRLVSYCNSSCQHANWPAHKKFCRAIGAFEDPSLRDSATLRISASTIEELQIQFQQRLLFCTMQLGRKLSPHEQMLLVFEPRCLFCGLTDQLIRIDPSIDPSVESRSLVPCANCHLSFACSTHWPLVYAEHTQAMCEGGYDGLAHCVLNQELIEDDEWDAKMLLLPERPPQYSAPLHCYRWIPARVTQAGWSSLKNATWAERFHAQLELEFPQAPPNVWIRRMSDILCMPMTALYALECLNTNLDWTRKEELTIHVIGAQSKELYNAICFENILHQLPHVKHVKIVLCGVELVPLLADDMRGGPYDILCCADCKRRGRRRSNEYYDVHYHDLPRKIGGQYYRPDLAIAFNSGAGEAQYISGWKRTIAFLVAHNVPSVFTAYTQSEALTDNGLLLEAGAALVPELGPCRNPWGSLLSKKDCGQLRKFYSDNMCLAGGFRGR